MGPFDAAGTDILHLRLVADEGIAGDAVPLRAGGEVAADRAALEAVVVDAVHMGVVDEQALAVAAAPDVAGDLRRLHEVPEQAVVPVPVAYLVAHHKAEIGNAACGERGSQ